MPQMFASLLALAWCACVAVATTAAQQLPLGGNDAPPPGAAHISEELFVELEELARIVDIAYCVGLTSNGINKPFQCASHCSGFTDVELVTTWNTGPLQSDSCGYIAVDHRKKRILLAFRGTYSIANTIVDLSTVPQKYEPYPGSDGERETRADLRPASPPCLNCTVHSGFHASWVNTRTAILPHIEQSRASYPDYQLHLIGHSLGGAVAALGGMDLQSRGWDPIVTTFGEPRIGNRALARYLDHRFELLESRRADRSLKFRRITHVDDPVPLLPLSEWGYAMHAGEIYISKASLTPNVEDLTFCDGDNDPRCIAAQDSSIVSDEETTSKSGKRSKRDLPAIVREEAEELAVEPWGIPSRYKLWQLFFAHRDYFWRLGLCIPSGYPFFGGGGGGAAADNGIDGIA